MFAPCKFVWQQVLRVMRKIAACCFEGVDPARDTRQFFSAILRRARSRRALTYTIFSVAAGLLNPAIMAEEVGTPADLTDLSLEKLMELEIPKVTGASKFEQKTTEAPSSITVITAEEIKRYGHRTLAEVLQSVQGFHVSYDRNYAFLGTRGINLGDFNSRILLLVDGHRINNNLTDGAFIDTAFLLDVDLIDRVEIIRGPGSVLYGNNAFFAVINVITRLGRQVDGAEVSGEYGSFDTYKGRATYGKMFTNGVQLLISGSWYDSRGDDRLYFPEFDQRISLNPGATNNGVARNLDDDQFGSVFGSISYRDFTLQGGYIQREKRNPTALIGANFNERGHGTTDERSYTALKYAHSFPEILDVTAQVYYDRYDFEIGYPAGTSFFEETQLGEWWGAELQLNKRLFDRHIITLGAEFQDNFEQSQRGVERNSGLVYNDVSRDRTSHGVYAQGDFAVLTNLHLNAGVRYDKYGDFDPDVNPRLAAIYNPTESSTLKALYGTAFRAPNFLELIDPRFQNLEPEEITSYELVYEQDIGRHLRSSASVFFNEMDDLIVFSSGSFTNFNAETRGVELALNGSWTNGIRGRLSYSYQDTHNHTVDWDMPDSPHHLIKLNLSVPLYRDKIFGGVEFQYISSRETLHNMPDPILGQVTVQGESTDGYGIVNLTLFSQDLIEDLEFSVSVYNVFDTQYHDPATRNHVQDALERDGRSYRLKLTYRF